MEKENLSVKYHNVEQLKPTVPNYKQWGIVKLYNNKQTFAKTVAWKTIDEIFNQNGNLQIKELIEKAYFNEKIRMKTDPYKIDPKDEKGFWSNIKKKLAGLGVNNLNEQTDEIKAITESIITRYANEIVGGFRHRSYQFAQKAIPAVLRRLLNSASARNVGRIFSTKRSLSERLFYAGEIDLIRELATKTTLVFVPTHFSNLDSMLVGWTINSIGVPPVTYGAGLNLYKNKFIARLIGRLGAYKLDRRKKNNLYNNTLKKYSQQLVEEECNSLFFPGGTRSRSGELETRFKLGLLGTIIDAQYENCKSANGDFKKIVIVPTVINYYFVLEAKQLIEQHLKKTGKEKFYLNNEADIKGFTTIVGYLWNFFSAQSQAAVTFCQPMDVFGNKLDKNLNSIDKNGNTISINEYFKQNDVYVDDAQRNMTFTQFLGDHILKSFRKGTIVFTSQIVAFVAYQMIQKQHPKMDIYGILRLPEEDRIIAYDDFSQNVYNLINHLKLKAKKKEILLDGHLFGSIDEVIQHGIKNLGAYHKGKLLTINKEGYVTSENVALLMFYHNRLTGFELENVIS